MNLSIWHWLTEPYIAINQIRGFSARRSLKISLHSENTQAYLPANRS
ncbi:hypothetical protein [uncultured Nostoc sp.]|nr:hypothetical protein [uncultured Nostoc sp.]